MGTAPCCQINTSALWGEKHLSSHTRNGQVREALFYGIGAKRKIPVWPSGQGDVAFHPRRPTDQGCNISHSAKIAENSVLRSGEAWLLTQSEEGFPCWYSGTFFIQVYSLTSAAVTLERSGEHIPVTGYDRRQKWRWQRPPLLLFWLLWRVWEKILSGQKYSIFS